MHLAERLRVNQELRTQDPAQLAEVLGRYAQVLVPEINLGQLSRILRSEFLVDAQSLSKMQGVPFRVGEIETAITVLLGGKP